MRSGRAIKKEKNDVAREAALERSRSRQQQRRERKKATGGSDVSAQRGDAVVRAESELGASSSSPSAAALAAADIIACPLGGVLAGVGSGVLGVVIGALKGSIRKEAGLGRLASAMKSSKSMAKTFAVFSGVYSIAGCYAKMLNGGVDNTLTVTGAGCVTGLAVSYSSGPTEALKSCAVLAAFSYFFDSSSTTTTTTTPLGDPADAPPSAALN